MSSFLLFKSLQLRCGSSFSLLFLGQFESVHSSLLLLIFFLLLKFLKSHSLLMLRFLNGEGSGNSLLDGNSLHSFKFKKFLLSFGGIFLSLSLQSFFLSFLLLLFSLSSSFSGSFSSSSKSLSFLLLSLFSLLSSLLCSFFLSLSLLLSSLSLFFSLDLKGLGLSLFLLLDSDHSLLLHLDLLLFSGDGDGSLLLKVELVEHIQPVFFVLLHHHVDAFDGSWLLDAVATLLLSLEWVDSTETVDIAIEMA